MVRESRHLWVGYLPEKIQEDELIKYFERFGPVQSVKLVRDVNKASGTSISASGSPGSCESESGTNASVSAAVAFIDIKSASRAHAAQHSLDGRTLKTAYYDAHANIVHTDNNTGSNNIAATAKTSSLLSGNAVAGGNAAAGGGDAVPATVTAAGSAASSDDDRSHVSSAPKSATKARRHSCSNPENEGLSSRLSTDQSDTGTPPDTPGICATVRTRLLRLASSASNANAASIESGTTPLDKPNRSHPHPRIRGRDSGGNSHDERERHFGPGGRENTKARTTSAADWDTNSLSQSSATAIHTCETASHGRDSRESSPGSQENAGSSASSSGKPAVFDTLSHDKQPLAICVRNLPSRSSDSSIKDGLFHEYKKYGKIVAVKLEGSGNDRYGIICFKRSEDVEKACDMSKDKKFFGASVQVSIRKEPVDLVDADYRLKDDEMDEYHPKATRTLYVGDLEKGIGESELRETFESFGEILDVDIKRQANGNSYAFIQFTDIGSVVKALRKMEGCTVGVSRVKVGFGKSMPTTCIWCDNLPDKIGERQLMTFFARAGPVRYCTVNRMSGQGLVFYETVDFAQTAITDLRSKSLQGRRLQLDYASRECQAAFFQEMERSGQMTMDRIKGEPCWEALAHNGNGARFPEREPFPPFTDARAHLNRQKQEKQRFSRHPGGIVENTPRIRTFQSFGADRPTEFEDSYERELWDYGYSQRERRSEKRTGDSPGAVRENGFSRHDTSDVESVYSDQSEHSSNRRLFRILSPSPPPSMNSRNSSARRQRSNTLAYTRQNSKNHDRTRSVSPSSPISPSLEEHNTASNGERPSQRSPARRPSDPQQRRRDTNTASRLRSLSRDSLDSETASPQRRRSGPHTPDSMEQHKEDSAVNLPMTHTKTHGDTADTDAPAEKVDKPGKTDAPVTSTSVESVLPDSNTPEVSSSKGSQIPCSTRRSSTASATLETGSDVVTSTVSHAVSPNSCHEPVVPSSPDSESSKKSEPPPSRSIVCGPMPAFYQQRINSRNELSLPPADLLLPEFASPMGSELSHREGSHRRDDDAPTPPSSPKHRSSFHDRMKALDEKFERISSVSGIVNQLKNRSVSVSENADKSSKAALVKRNSDFSSGSLPKIPEHTSHFRSPERVGLHGEDATAVQVKSEPWTTAQTSSAATLSNIARYAANPKFTVRSVTSTAPASVPDKAETSEPASTSKPVTSDISAKILSITAEASAKFSQQQHQKIKTEPETKHAKSDGSSSNDRKDDHGKSHAAPVKAESSSKKKTEPSKAESATSKKPPLVKTESTSSVKAASPSKPVEKVDTKAAVESKKTEQRLTKQSESKSKGGDSKGASSVLGLFFGEDPNAKMFRKNIQVLTPHAMKLEKEKAERAEREREKLEKERLERERVEKEKAEKERIERERVEKLEKERLEKERIRAERERERQEKERLEQERIEKERAEKEKAKILAEKLEKEKQERERAARLEKAAKEKAEKERQEKERHEKERLEKEKQQLAAAKSSSKKTEKLVPKVDEVPQDLSMKKKEKEPVIVTVPHRSSVKSETKPVKQEPSSSVSRVKEEAEPLRGLAALARQCSTTTDEDRKPKPAESASKPVSKAPDVPVKRPKISLFGGEEPRHIVSKEKEKKPEPEKKVIREEKLVRVEKEIKVKRKRLSSSSSNSVSRSPSPVRRPPAAPGKKPVDLSGSEKNETAPSAPRKRGRKKKVVRETSSESENSSDEEPPKKNIFEVSLNPEDLQCSMYDKIKRRACTKTVAPPVAPAASSRPSAVAARESMKKDSPARKNSIVKQSRNSSMVSSSEEDEKGRKMSSSATVTSPDSDYSDKPKKPSKRKSPVHKKPQKSHQKSRKMDSDSDSTSVSDSDFSLSDTEKKKSHRKGQLKKDTKSSRRSRKSLSGTRSSMSNSSSADTSVSVSPEPQKSKKVSKKEVKPVGETASKKPTAKQPPATITQKSSKAKPTSVPVPAPQSSAKPSSPPSKPAPVSQKKKAGVKDREKDRPKSKSPEKEKTREKDKTPDKGKPRADDKQEKAGGFDGDTYNLSMLMKSNFMETASRESSVASPATGTPLKQSTSPSKILQTNQKADKGKPAPAEVKRKEEKPPVEARKKPDEPPPKAKSKDSKNVETEAAKPTEKILSPKRSPVHVKSPPRIEPVKQPVYEEKPLIIERPKAPVYVQPVHEASPEPEPPTESNIEEGEEAAAALQQLMDSDPVHEEPVIHIPDRDDGAYGEDGMRETELAASIASIEAAPEVKPTVGVKTLESPRHEVERKRELPASMYEPVPQPEFRPIPKVDVAPEQREHSAAAAKHDHDRHRTSTTERAAPAGLVPPAEAAAPPQHISKMPQNAPIAQPVQEMQYHAPVMHGTVRNAAEAMLMEEMEAKRMKKNREPEHHVQPPAHPIMPQNVGLQLQPASVVHQSTSKPSPMQMPPSALSPKFDQGKMEEHFAQMQRPHQEINPAMFMQQQMGFAAGGMATSQAFRPPLAGFPHGMHVPGRDELIALQQQQQQQQQHPQQQQNASAQLQGQLPPPQGHPESRDRKSKKRKASAAEENVQQHSTHVPNQPTMDMHAARMMLQQQGQFTPQGQQLLMRFPGQNMPQLPPQQQQQQIVHQQQQPAPSQFPAQQQQQPQQGKQPIFGPGSHMRPPSAVPSSSHPTNDMGRGNTHGQPSGRSHLPVPSPHKTDGHHGTPSPVISQPKSNSHPQMPSPVPPSPQGMQPSPQMPHHHPPAPVEATKQKSGGHHHNQSQQPQQHRMQPVSAHSGTPAPNVPSSASVPVIMSTIGRPAQAMHPLQGLAGNNSGGLVINSATGAPMFIPAAQQHHQPAVQEKHHKENQQNTRASAIQSSQSSSHSTPAAPSQPAAGSSHSSHGRSSAVHGQYPSQNQPHPNPSPMPIDPAHFALLQGFNPNDSRAMSGAIAKLLQHPHQQNMSEFQKEQHQQHQAPSHPNRPEPISLQSSAEKNRSQQEAARHTPANVLRPNSTVAFSTASGLIPGVDVPSAFLTPQFVYGPYGFPPEMVQAGAMDGRLPLGMNMAAFRPPFMASGLSEANLQQAMHAAAQAEIRGHHQSGHDKLEQLQHLQRMDSASGHQQRSQWPSGIAMGGLAAMQPGPSMPAVNSFPVVWQGHLTLKNDQALVRMHIISGNQELSRLSLPGFPDPSQNVLKISQRMRLEQAQLDSVSSRMNDADAHCILVACATAKSAAEQAHQGEMLRNGFVNYLTAKQAAGIVNVAPHGPNSSIQYVIHIFPPCEFSNQTLARFGPNVMQAIEQQPHLFVVITKSMV